MKKTMLIPASLIFLFPFKNDSSAETTPLFTRHDYSIEGITSKLAVGNFNNDDVIDIITVNNTGIISVFSGNGDGSFADAVTFSAETGEPDKFIVDDFNIDGISDVVINDKLMLGNGSGSFNEGTILETQGLYPSLSGDVIMDGKPDLLVVRGYVEDEHKKFELQVFPGNGDGTFGEPVLHELPGAISLYIPYIGDFNSDNLSDILISYYLGYDDSGPLFKTSAPSLFYNFGIIPGNGDGIFGDVIVTEWYYASSVCNFNNDNILDIIGGIFLEPDFHVMLGDGYGNFSSSWKSPGVDYGGPKKLILDVNGDDILDIGMVVSSGGNFITRGIMFFTGNGDGSFKEPVEFVINDFNFTVYRVRYNVSDFNNDGYDDFIIAPFDSSYISVFLNNGIISSIENEKQNRQTISQIVLKQNTPNPFNPSTTISFSISHQRHIILSVYDITGQKVATLVDSPMSAGSHSVIFNGSDLGSGVYLYKLESKGFTKTGKMLLMK